MTRGVVGGVGWGVRFGVGFTTTSLGGAGSRTEVSSFVTFKTGNGGFVTINGPSSPTSVSGVGRQETSDSDFGSLIVEGRDASGV